MTAQNIKSELQSFGNPQKANHSLRFFKTGKGDYGEGDLFIGVTVPESRSVAKKYLKLPITELEKLLKDEIHECRFCAQVILTEQFNKGDETLRRKLVDLYLAHTKYINNWDLVDVSAHKIVGEWLKDKTDRSLLYTLAKSDLLWDRRIAVVATFTLIRNNDFADILNLSEYLLTDKHDLMHKACGWMLREVGKKNEPVLTGFLDKHCISMPRTMLRYSIERLSPEQRKQYLQSK